MRTLLIFLLGAASLFAATKENIKYEKSESGNEVVSGQVLVRYKVKASIPKHLTRAEKNARAKAAHEARRATIDRIKKKHDVDGHAKIAREEHEPGLYVLHSRTKTTKQLITELSRDPDVESVREDLVFRLNAEPTDTYWTQLWGLRNTGQAIPWTCANTSPSGFCQGFKVDPDVWIPAHVTEYQSGVPGIDSGAYNAWPTTTGAGDFQVAVIDSGVDLTHPDLIANQWVLPVDVTVPLFDDTTMTCAAGSHGFDYTYSWQRDCVPQDCFGHGTHVTGTIAATGNDGVGVIGVAPSAKYITFKVGDCAGSLSGSAVIAAQDTISYLNENGIANIRVTNNSYGGTLDLPGDFPPSLWVEDITYQAWKRLDEQGIVQVTAAGNEYTATKCIGTMLQSGDKIPIGFCTPNMIGVLAMGNTGARSNFSNWNAYSSGQRPIDVAAPGQMTLSTNVRVSGQNPSGVSYAYLSGTSMAAPHVAGVVALTMAARPELAGEIVKAIVVSTVTKRPSLSGLTTMGGYVNAAESVRVATEYADNPHAFFRATATNVTLK